MDHFQQLLLNTFLPTMTFIFRLLLGGPEILKMISLIVEKKKNRFFSFNCSYVCPRASITVLDDLELTFLGDAVFGSLGCPENEKRAIFSGIVNFKAIQNPDGDT